MKRTELIVDEVGIRLLFHSGTKTRKLNEV